MAYYTYTHTTLYYRSICVFVLSLLWPTWFHSGDVAALIVTTDGQKSVREGGSVTLTCTYSPRTDPAFEFGALSWQIGNGHLVTVSIRCPSSCSTFNTDPVRFTLDVDQVFSGNFTIVNASLEDDNTYRCTVTSVIDHVSAMVRLVVNVPPVSIKIYDDSNQNGYDNGALVPVMSGRSYTLICIIAPGANPPAELDWNGGDVRISKGGQDNQPVGTSKLTVSRRDVTFYPSMSDHLRQVSCITMHPALQSPLERYVQLDVQVPPSEVEIEYNSGIIQSGNDVTLRQDTPSAITCRSKATRPASEIAWYFGGIQVFTGVTPLPATQNSDDSLLFDAVSIIVIQPTREDHGKTLQCRATAAGISGRRTVTLSVEGPPDDPVITGVQDTLTENQPTNILCRADNGYPAPTFQWTIGSRDISLNATLQMSTDSNDRIDATSQLSYTPFRGDNGLRLQCSVTHLTLTQAVTAESDSLNIDYCPASVVVTACPRVTEGSFETLRCRSGASNPAASLVWIRDTTTIGNSDSIQTQEPSTNPSGTMTTLSYRRNFTRADNGIQFMCCATRCSSTCSLPCRSDVQYPPTVPVLVRNIQLDPVPEGTTNLEITCSADGNPKPALVWIYGDNPGVMLDQAMQSDGSRILRMREVRRGNAGIYRCIANNDIKFTQQADTSLVVNFPPIITNMAENRAAANEGKTATLTCIAEANPAATVRWYNRTGELILRSDRIIIENMPESNAYKTTTVSNLKILAVVPKVDHGDYRCAVENDLGEDMLVIHLNGTSKPEPPIRVRVVNAQTSAHSLLVTWQPGFDGGVAQSFIVQYCVNDTSENCQNRTGIKMAELVIDTLESFTWYQISVFAENVNGFSVIENYILASTSPRPPSEYGLTVTSDKGVVTLTSNPDVVVPDDVCFKIQTQDDVVCSQTSQCYKPGEKVQRYSDEKVAVVSFGRGLCSVPEKASAAKLSTSPGSGSTVTGAVVGALVVVALVAVVIIVAKRNHDRRGKGAAKVPSAAVRPGPDGKSANKNGQMQPFLSGGYCAYNPVYDDVAHENTDRNSNSNDGRVVSEDGLIYAEVTHFREHPEGKPPIRTEDATIYAALDFPKMKQEEEKPLEIEEKSHEEALIYENVTHPSLP